jgi:hypothetical protein
MGKRMRRVARPFDRLVLGAIMTVVIFVIERVLVRSRKDISPS